MSNKKSKHRWSLWLIALLFFIGVASILYPVVSNLLNVMTANTVTAGYDNEVQNMSDNELDELLKQAQHYNAELYKGTADSEDAKCLNRTDGIMCYLDVPSINVYLPVYYGTSEDVLQKGCGYLENTSLPVGGENTHSVISGHTGLPSAKMLTDLDQVEVGDMFYIHVLGEVLAYKIDDIHAVTPDSTDSLRIVPGEDYVTLLTCTPYGINDKRLLVRGVRVPYDPDAVADTEEKITDPPTTQDGLDWAVMEQIINISLIVLVALIVFVIAILIVRHNTKKLRRDNAEKHNDDEKQEE